MSPLDFCYWLQGHLELNGSAAGLSPEQLDIVRRHLQLVFEKKTDVGKPTGTWFKQTGPDYPPTATSFLPDETGRMVLRVGPLEFPSRPNPSC